MRICYRVHLCDLCQKPIKKGSKFRHYTLENEKGFLIAEAKVCVDCDSERDEGATGRIKFTDEIVTA